MRRLYAIAVFPVVLLCGCSIHYDYELRLVVTNAETGQPLEGVTVALDYMKSEDQAAGIEYFLPIAERSDANGQLNHDFSTRRTSEGKWCVRLQKAGFEPVVVSLPADTRENKKPRERYAFPATAQMKPRPVDPNEVNPEHERPR